MHSKGGSRRHVQEVVDRPIQVHGALGITDDRSAIRGLNQFDGGGCFA
jgi:hypothetical protein